MSSKKIKNEAHTPNEWEKIDRAVGESGQFVDKNHTKIIAAVVVLLVIIAGYLGYQNLIVKPKLAEAQKEMFKAEEYYRQGKDSLAIYGDASGNLGFETIIEKYGSTDAGNVAKLYAGISHARMGNYDKALDYIKAFSSDDKILQYLAQGTIGDCLVNTGKTQEAIPYFINAAKGADNLVQSPIMYKKAGLIYRDMKEYDKVIEMFSLIKNNYMNSPLAQEADKYIEEAKLQKGA